MHVLNGKMAIAGTVLIWVKGGPKQKQVKMEYIIIIIIIIIIAIIYK
jgi:hypothetical protein